MQEKKMPHGLSIEESRRILGLSELPMEAVPCGTPKNSDDETRYEQIGMKA